MEFQETIDFIPEEIEIHAVECIDGVFQDAEPLCMYSSGNLLERIFQQVGLRAVDAAEEEVITTLPHGNDYTFLADRDFLIDGQPVTHVSIPTMGAVNITESKLKSSTYHTSSITLPTCHNISSTVVGGVRKKLDGVEVIQMQIEASCSIVTFEVTPTGVTRSRHLGAATMEVVGDKRFLLNGHTSDKTVLQHEWRAPTRRTVNNLLTNTEGVIVNVNGVDHKMRNRWTTTLMHVGHCLVDASGVKYYIPDGSYGPKGLNDYYVSLKNGHLVLTYQRERPDKSRPDSTEIVRQLANLPTALNLLFYFPSLESDMFGYKVIYNMPDADTTYNNALIQKVVSQEHCGPLTWIAAFRDRLTAEGFGELWARENYSLTPNDISRSARESGYYVRGANVYLCRPRRIRRARVVGDKVICTVPPPGNWPYKVIKFRADDERPYMQWIKEAMPMGVYTIFLYVFRNFLKDEGIITQLAEGGVKIGQDEWEYSLRSLNMYTRYRKVSVQGPHQYRYLKNRCYWSDADVKRYLVYERLADRVVDSCYPDRKIL